MAIISTALSTSSAVDVENLTFSYQRNCLNLEDINMHVPRGTIYGLLGPSGCGKTTLLRCIVGRLKPRCGHVAVFGYRPGTKECGIPGPNIGYMPQELSLISQFTVRETLEYYAGFAKQNAHQQSLDARIEFLLKLLDISEFEHIYTDRLSGGQQRRVSLAVAMINDPPLLILDEPTVGVDPIVRESIWSYLVDQSKNGLTVIVTTHYIEEAGSADKVGFMRQGRILAEGNPNYLMLQHNVSSMERLFLKLSQQDDFRHQDYPKDILLQLEAKHHFSSKHNESTKNGQKASDQSSEKSMDPQTVVYTNGSASFVKTKPSALLALSPPMPPTQQQKQQLSATVSPNSNHSHNNHNQKSQHTIMVEQYKQLDPDSLIETPIAPDASTTNSFHNNNNNNNNNNCKLNNNDFHETASDSPLFNNNCSSSSSSSSSTTSSRQKKSTKSPSSNTSGREMRTYSVHGHDRSVNSIQKIGVLCRKHRIRLFRRVPELVITMLLPALEVALFCLCMGRDPTSVQMAVCNQENPPFLSLLFLKSIDSDFISLKYYKTPEEAIDSVRNADTYSAIVLAKNFSTLLKQFGQHGGGPPGLMQPFGQGNNHNRQQQLFQNRVQTVTLAHRQPSTLSTTTAPTPPPSSMYTTTTSSTTSMMNQKNRSKLVTNTNQPMPPLMTPFIPPSQPTQSMLKTTGGNIDGDHGDGGTGLRRVRRNISDFVATTMITPKSMQQPVDMDKNNDDDEDTIIRIYYDGSNALHVNIIRREVFSALFRFIDTASKTLGGGLGHGYKLPIKFEKPIYGGEKTDMVEFVGPGLMVFIVFFATMSITSMAFLSERREGTLERSMIVGMTPTEFIIAQIINITFLLIVQIILTVVMGFWIFDFPMKGSYVLAVTMMFLQGLCGMTFGLMLSAICTSEMTALALGAGSQLMFCFITGIFWPVETMIALLRYISYAMPQTKPMESFRHILIRGFDLSKPAVLNGYLITLAWIGFFLIVAIVIFRVR